ncbi:hypothetical protein [Mycolicibacterium canariasense]|nr:hypothetical protein [Mycolicibacterium canariasense]
MSRFLSDPNNKGVASSGMGVPPVHVQLMVSPATDGSPVHPYATMPYTYVPRFGLTFTDTSMLWLVRFPASSWVR